MTQTKHASLWNGSFSPGNQTQLRCYDCQSWRGVCVKGKRNRIAKDEACGDFEPRGGAPKP